MTEIDFIALTVSSYNTARTIVELQSLAFTIPVLLLCFLVIKEGIGPLKASTGQTRWILLGICLGFAGNFVDNLYWMFPWTANYLEDPRTGVLVSFGVFPNLIFRQGLTIAAAYCHLRAFIPRERKRLVQIINLSILSATLCGQLFIFCLWQVNHYKKTHEERSIDIYLPAEEQGHRH